VFTHGKCLHWGVVRKSLLFLKAKARKGFVSEVQFRPQVWLMCDGHRILHRSRRGRIWCYECSEVILSKGCGRHPKNKPLCSHSECGTKWTAETVVGRSGKLECGYTRTL
jgi:hypothetical protein